MQGIYKKEDCSIENYLIMIKKNMPNNLSEKGKY